jgi:polyisoprenoid-binding protein YceI
MKMNISGGFIIVLLIVSTLFNPAFAQHYVPAAKGSKVELKFTNHKAEEVVKCSLGAVKGKIIFDPKNLSAASFDITVGTAGLGTGMAEWNKNLKSEAFFNTKKYPVIRLKSASVTQDRGGSIVYIIHGNLTIKGITKPVNIQFIGTPMGTGYMFRGGFEISRSAFGLGTKEDGLDDPVSVFMEIKTEKK